MVAVVGYVQKEQAGWRASVGPPPGRYLTSYNTAKEAKAAVEQQIRTASQAGVRWQRPVVGYYEAVTR